MSFGGVFLERPCRLPVPIDRAERLEGFRCILLHRHQVVSVVAFDDAAGGISGCVHRVYRDNMSVKRHFFEKRPDGSSFAILVMKTVTGNGQPRVMRNQSRGFEIVVPVAVRAPEALAIGGKRSTEVDPRRSPTFQYRFNLRLVRLSRTRYMTDFDGGSYCFVFGLNHAPSDSSSVWFSARAYCAAAILVPKPERLAEMMIAKTDAIVCLRP